MANPLTNMTEIAAAAPMPPLPGTSKISPTWVVYQEAVIGRDMQLTIGALALTTRASAVSARQQVDAAISNTVAGGGTKVLAIKKLDANMCVTLGSTVDNTLPTTGGDQDAQQADEEDDMDALLDSATGMQQNDPGNTSVAAAIAAMQHSLSTAPRPPTVPRPQQNKASNRPSGSGGGNVVGRPFNLGGRGNFLPQRRAPTSSNGGGRGAMEVDSQCEGEHDPLQAQVGRANMNHYGPNVRDQLYAPLNNSLRGAPGGHPRPSRMPAPPPRAPNATRPTVAPRRTSPPPRIISLVANLGWVAAMWPSYRGTVTFIVTQMVMVCHLLYISLCRVRAALGMTLDYWLHLTSQPPHAHVRCIFYVIGGLYFLVCFAAPIAALSTPLSLRAHSGITSLMHIPTGSLKTMAVILPIGSLLMLAILCSHAAWSASLTEASPTNSQRIYDPPTATVLNNGTTAATRRTSECSRTRNNKYIPAASSYIEDKLSHLRLTGARRWGLSARLCRQVRRQVWNLDHERPPSGSMARLRYYLNKHHQKCLRSPIYRSWKNSSRAPPPPCVMVGGANGKQIAVRERAHSSAAGKEP